MPKPVRKKKHFIRKKESTTYQLISGFVPDQDEEPAASANTEEVEARKEEQRHYGIFYEDGYNYMKHIRAMDEVATMVSTNLDGDETRSQAPSMRSSVFPQMFREFFSTDETEDEKIDPEILAALEEAPKVSMDIDLDDKEGGLDFLDDDFMVQAGGVVEKEIDEEVEYVEEDDREHDFDDEEEEDSESESDDESVISNRLSVSSCEEDDTPSTRRQRGTAEDDMIEAQTALILKNFEQGLGFRVSTQDTPDDQEMPTAEDYIHLKHTLKSDILKPEPASWYEVLDDKSERPKIDTSKYLYESEDEFEWKEVPPSKPKFDCVSILSTRSNTRNLPTDILPPPKEKTKKKREQSECESTAPSQGLTLQQLEQDLRESRRADRASTFRPEDETLEEKRTRKKAIKDERKERRQEKKANKTVFSIENEKMKKETATLSKAVKSVKLT